MNLSARKEINSFMLGGGEKQASFYDTDQICARYYLPELAHFISEDPLGVQSGLNFYAYVDSVGKPFTPATNWYSYAGNDPINKTDPLGLFEVDANSLYYGFGIPFEDAAFWAKEFNDFCSAFRDEVDCTAKCVARTLILGTTESAALKYAEAKATAKFVKRAIPVVGAIENIRTGYGVIECIVDCK